MAYCYGKGLVAGVIGFKSKTSQEINLYKTAVKKKEFFFVQKTNLSLLNIAKSHFSQIHDSSLRPILDYWTVDLSPFGKENKTELIGARDFGKIAACRWKLSPTG